MLKGLIALFTTGIIFNPSVLAGILFGVPSALFLEDEKLTALYKNYNLYIFFFLVAVVLTYYFKKTYRPHTFIVDWSATFKTMISQFILLVFSFFMSLLFADFFTVSDMLEKDNEGLYNSYDQILGIKH